MELIITHATVIDGTGRDAFQADVGVDNGKIVLNPIMDSSATIINGDGKIVCPGFIDSHSHGDLVCGKDFQNLCKVSQGITTEVAGNCGITLAPINPNTMSLIYNSGEYSKQADMPNWTTFSNYMQYLDLQPKALNTALLVGHSTLRTAVMGYSDRKATPTELKQMQNYLEEAMLAGAFGMSTGLVYIPGTFADTEELLALGHVLKKYGGEFTSHMRNESYDVIKSVSEIIQIGKQADIPVVISHHKVLGRPYWGLQKQTLALIEQAVKQGVQVSCDQYPYTRNMTSTRVCIPPEYFNQDLAETVELLKRPEIRAEIRSKMEDYKTPYDNYYLNAGGWDGILVCTSPGVPDAVGKTIQEYADSTGQDPFEAYFDLMIQTNCVGHSIFNSMCEDDVLEIASFEHTVVGTDGDIYSAEDITHPRVYGTFPHAICYYVKQKKILTLEQMIHKMTYQTAQIHHLKNKGAILDGFDADLVIFDYDQLQDRATYLNANLLTDGIEQVIVNGTIVYENKRLTGNYPGKILRHQML